MINKLLYTIVHNFILNFSTEHETEISLFKKEDYKKYQANPILKW